MLLITTNFTLKTFISYSIEYSLQLYGWFTYRIVYVFEIGTLTWNFTTWWRCNHAAHSNFSIPGHHVNDCQDCNCCRSLFGNMYIYIQLSTNIYTGCDKFIERNFEERKGTSHGFRFSQQPIVGNFMEKKNDR